MAEAFEAARVSMPAVIARSLNRAAKSTAVAASRELAKQTGLKARAARENVEVTKHASHISATGPHHWFERTGRERLPIREVEVEADLPERVERPDIVRLAEHTAREVFEARMRHEMERVLAIGAKYRAYAGERE